MPSNPLLARSLPLNRYIEEMETGTLDTIRRCTDAGLSEPEFNDSSGFKITIWRRKPTEQIKVETESLPGDLKSKVINLLADGPMSRSELSKKLGQKKPTGHLYNVVRDLLNNQMIEYTLPDIPRSRWQQYQLTDKGKNRTIKAEIG